MAELRNRFKQFVCTVNEETGVVVTKNGKNIVVFVLRIGDSFVREYKGVHNEITRTADNKFNVDSHRIVKTA